MKTFIAAQLDTLGMFSSLLCAIHCAGIPLLLAFTTWSGLLVLSNPYIEITIVCLSIGLALASIFPSYRKLHKKLNAIVLVTIGFMLIAFGHIVSIAIWEVVSTSLGALLVASAHIENWRLCRNCSVNQIIKKS
jgi:hypothetical protein